MVSVQAPNTRRSMDMSNIFFRPAQHNVFPPSGQQYTFTVPDERKCTYTDRAHVKLARTHAAFPGHCNFDPSYTDPRHLLAWGGPRSTHSPLTSLFTLACSQSNLICTS